jgi:CubicO group peptidase (beta-lactamase class C family)
MRLIAVLCFLAALTGYLPAIAQQAARGSEGAARPALLSARVAPTVEGKATGYVLVTWGDATLMARGFGSEAERIPTPTRATAFDLSSISKLFTAVAILRLADQNRVNLDSPIRRYLPELPARLQDITLRHALQHDTGFPPYLTGDDQTQKSAAEVLAEIASISRERQAGSGFAYSDVGYVALALVVERVSGRPFREAMRQLVLRPAKLTRTGFYGDRWAPNSVAMEYAKGAATGSPATFRFTYAIAGTGQVATTVDDLRRLFAQLNAGGFLSRRSRLLLFSPGISTSGRLPYRGPDVLDVTYSMGLFHFRDRQGRIAHGHGGANEFGGHAFVYWRPDDELFVAALFNSGAQTFARGAFMAAVTAAD